MSEPTDIARVDRPGALAFTGTRDQIELIKRTVAKGTTDDELALFIHVCRRAGLDPLSRQIHAIKRKQWNKETKQHDEVMVIQTGIDGLRLQAERTGKFRGSTTALWCGTDGEWKEVWFDTTTPPVAAKVGVFREDHPEPIFFVALFHEYAQRTNEGKLMGRWNTGAAGQLAKCAEAGALRKAFPAELAGIYSDEEMAHLPAAGEPEPKRVQQPERKSAKGPKESKAAKEAAKNLPPTNPYQGDLDDITPDEYEVKGEKVPYWRIRANGGAILFVSKDRSCVDVAASAMSNGRAVMIEWHETSAGNAEILKIGEVMDA